MCFKFGLCVIDDVTLISCGHRESYGCIIEGTNSYGIWLAGDYLTGFILGGRNNVGCCLVCNTKPSLKNNIMGCCCFECEKPKSCRCCLIYDPAAKSAPVYTDASVPSAPVPSASVLPNAVEVK